MNKINVFAASAAAVTLLSAPVFAGGMTPVITEPVATPVPVVAVPTSADWTGGYAGLSLGYGDASTSAGLVNNADDLTYGVFAGYMQDLGSLVLGGEVEFSGSDIADGTTGVGIESETQLKVKAGYDAGSWLPYLTAGWSSLSTDGAVNATDTGYVYGAGLDYQMTDSVRVGAEVLNHQYDDFNASGVDQEMTTIGLRAAYTF